MNLVRYPKFYYRVSGFMLLHGDYTLNTTRWSMVAAMLKVLQYPRRVSQRPTCELGWRTAKTMCEEDSL